MLASKIARWSAERYAKAAVNLIKLALAASVKNAARNSKPAFKIDFLLNFLSAWVSSESMRQLFVTVTLGLIGLGCASNPLPIQSPPIVQAPEITTDPVAQEVAPRRIPALGRVCPLAFPRREVGSVIRIPGAMMSLAMDPVMSALCACTKPGEYATIVARIDFDKGQVETRAPESPIINACLEMLHITFPPPPPNEMPASDCINCGPRYYGVFVDSPPPPKPEGIRLVYSFALDRSNEILQCPAAAHPERGACVVNAEPKPTIPDKPRCTCAAEDLMCAMKCAAQKK